MAYLGNSPVLSQQEYRNIDDISGSFNGSTTSFPLLVNGVAPIPGPQTSNQCLISVNGVIQKPDDTGASGFRISGGNIVFSSAPTGGQTFFGVILAGADYIYAGENFPDGTVSAPTITFAQDLDTGFYRSGAGEVKFTANGVNTVTFSSNGLTAPNFIPSGSAVPANGIYLPSANNVAIATNSTQRLLIDSAGQIEAVSLGSAAAPTWSFTTDPNTGIYSPGADQVAISTNGQGRLFINSTGQVSAGTASALSGATLTVAGNSLAITGQNTAHSANSIRIGEDGAGVAELRAYGPDASTNGSFRFRVSRSDGSNSQDVVIDSSGRFGVGTSSPSSPLHVAGGRTLCQTGNEDYSLGIARSGATNAYYLGVHSSTSPNLLFSNNGGTTRMVLTDGGSLGIGTTSPTRSLMVAAGSASSNGILVTGSNSPSYRIEETSGSVAAQFGLDGSASYFGTSTNHPQVFNTNATERARIDTSGRLLVGTSSNNTSFGSSVQIAGTAAEATQLISRYIDSSGGPQLYFAKSRSGTIGTNTIVQVDDQLGFIGFYGANGTSYDTGASIAAFVDATPGASSDMPSRLVFSTTADGAISPTERMRIGQNGSVQIGRTTGQIDTELFTVQNGGQCGWIYQTANSNVVALTMRHTYAQSAQTAKMISFLQSNGAEVGAITSTTTATAYGTSSDYRLKENVIEVTDGIARLQQLKPSRFNFIADPDKTVDGFIAHEVQAIVPEAIIGEKDAVDDEGNPVYQGIDQSKLVPLLTAALQEAIGRIESLEAEVAALKAQ